MIDKSKLKELALAATPGPYTFGTEFVAKPTGAGTYTYIARCPEGEEDTPKWDANAAFFAAANPAAILELLAELESARNAALEEAAKLVLSKATTQISFAEMASAIRSLATTTSTEPAEFYAKAYICKGCGGVYIGEPVTKCDCMPEKQEFDDAVVLKCSTEPAKEPVACDAALRAEPAGSVAAGFAVPASWKIERAAPARIVVTDGSSMRSLSEDAEPTLFRYFSQITTTAEQSNMAGAARQGGNTCDLTDYSTPVTYSNGTGTSPAPSAKQEPSCWREFVDNWMGEHDVVLKTAAYRALLAAPSASASPAAPVAQDEAHRARLTLIRTSGDKALCADVLAGRVSIRSALAKVLGFAPVAGSQQVHEMLRELVQAMRDYQMDVDHEGPAPEKHRDMMRRAETLLAAAPAVPVPAEQKPDVAEMVNRFLGWPLPNSVLPDGCVMNRNYPHRVGTHLLTADEAKAMFEYVLAAPSLQQGKEGAGDE